MSEYSDRIFVIVEWSKLIAANAQAQAWDPDSGGDDTFGSVRLSANGLEPPTHSGCNTLATPNMRTQILAALGNVPFVAVYMEADGWAWDTSLLDAGLKNISSEGI